ncbi:MAG: Prepilin peptidase [Candidatus Gottesmanbacteria bacterium GW2011_GWA1_47_8]|uniref:Prepilin peptidase n=2 Tax=Candidatus Gottesmaniibacteriota TaxID=1752720 RepID=A0A0G1TFY8_9BACT|nr:MAG: Prepilin peptidase [Candidatus Gottesmanbacteria bacterium GW2011_GWA1_47_8]
MELLVFVLGLCVGSFANVLIDRLPKGESVWFGRSHCDHCKKTLRWFELIPLLSFVLQTGRCRRCHKKLSIQYPLVELATGFMVVLIQGQAFEARQGLALGLIFSSLLVIFVADLKYMIIPDSMIVIGIFGVLLQGRALGGLQGSALSGLGAAVFFLALFLVTRGRGMGFGDVKLAFLLGLWLGFPRIIIALYLAFLTGAVVGVTLILGRKKKLKSKIAFGPFLVIGAIGAYFYSGQILTWWEGIL